MMRRRKCTGVTLIEVLVVVGILVCLVGILLPVLLGAREQSKRVHCLSNLKSLTAAWLAYAADNEGHVCNNGSEQNWSWIRNLSGPRGLENGKLWPYLNTAAVYRCPNDQHPQNISSYQVNGAVGSKLNDISQPSKTFVFIEGCSISPLVGQPFPTPIYPSSIFPGVCVPGENHPGAGTGISGGTCMSFADGHASFWTYGDYRTGMLLALAYDLQFGTLGLAPHIPPCDANSSDVYQLEAWSGGVVPPGASQ